MRANYPNSSLPTERGALDYLLARAGATPRDPIAQGVASAGAAAT